MCSLLLTHPSGAVGRLCGARGAVGGSVPCSRVSPQSWTLPARAGIRTHNLVLPRVSSPTLYPLGHDCPRSRLCGRIQLCKGKTACKFSGKSCALLYKYEQEITYNAFHTHFFFTYNIDFTRSSQETIG